MCKFFAKNKKDMGFLVGRAKPVLPKTPIFSLFCENLHIGLTILLKVATRFNLTQVEENELHNP